MENIHREAAKWKYYFMKYDILVQTFTSSLVRKQYCQKKFSPKIREIFFMSKSVSGYYKTKKKRKKSGMDH